MTPEISVVVPLRNESPNVERLYRDVTASLTQFGRSYEIVAVDDGSRDETFELLARLQAKDPRVRVIRFRRNFGQTAAFAAGFAAARGRFVITADGDLQNDLSDIPRLVGLAESNDIVCGWRRRRHDALLTKRLLKEIDALKHGHASAAQTVCPFTLSPSVVCLFLFSSSFSLLFSLSIFSFFMLLSLPFSPFPFASLFIESLLIRN